MKSTLVFISLLMAGSICLANETALSTSTQAAPKSAKKEKKQKAANYFNQSAKDVSKLVKHSLFQKYPDYIIENIRMGEIAGSQAYFVRLEKPFSADSKGMCFTFLGTSEEKVKPHECERAE